MNQHIEKDICESKYSQLSQMSFRFLRFERFL